LEKRRKGTSRVKADDGSTILSSERADRTGTPGQNVPLRLQKKPGNRAKLYPRRTEKGQKKKVSEGKRKTMKSSKLQGWWKTGGSFRDPYEKKLPEELYESETGALA